VTVTNVNEAFEEMVTRAIPPNLEAIVQFDLGGEGGGQWYLDIANSACTAYVGQSDNAKTTISMDAGDFLAMTNGELNAMAAFMQGKIKVSGDMGLVMQLQSLLG